MCLIVFAWKLLPECPLIAASNRDEFFARPTEPAGWWIDHPHVYAGRDLQGGGTWLGVNKQGRFAALTNIRNGEPKRPDAPTRGALVADYLSTDISTTDYLQHLAASANRYQGYNLLLGDAENLYWFSNEGATDPRNGQPLSPGIYGLSNGLLDASWPKTVSAKAQFASLLCQTAPDDAYFDMLSDTTRASDCRLPKTGVSLEWERLLSPICIESADYGTRASTLVRLNGDRSAKLVERVIR
jgi:uncharacterized protein with NRDE domain